MSVERIAPPTYASSVSHATPADDPSVDHILPPVNTLYVDCIATLSDASLAIQRRLYEIPVQGVSASGPGSFLIQIP